MSVIFLLLLASLSVSVIFLGAFIWSIRNGQLDDEISPSMRILFEDEALSHSSAGMKKPASPLSPEQTSHSKTKS
jgi:cbb3-type cytochrome oxidase maturation protein